MFCRSPVASEKPTYLHDAIHQTSPNKTDKLRYGLAIHFLHTDHTDYAKPELIEESRTTRPYLTRPEATGGLKEYSVKLEGTWEQEVERVLTETETVDGVHQN